MEIFLQDLLQVWFGQLEQTLSRYLFFAVALWLTIWIVLGSVLKARKIRESTPPGRQLLMELASSLRSMAIFATVAVVILHLEQWGLYPLQPIAQAWGPLWFAASLVITIVVHDAYFYWTHRFMHDPRVFKRLHRRHHRSNNPSPFTAYSFDLGEAGLMVAFFVIWPMIFPMAWGVNGFFMLFQIVRNTFLHCGYELRPAHADGRPWLGFFTTTTHHDLHHAQAGWNYGAWFTWWDRWMGTEHPEYLNRYAAAAWRPFAAKNKVKLALDRSR
jgi:sterol desaturase/sphingolipid hydroxylase (fatty acid hydroxylase superfamily)